MKKFLCIKYLLAVSLPLVLFAQESYPANVEEPIFWLKTKNKKGNLVIEEQINKYVFNFKGNEKEYRINNNFTFYFNAGVDSLNIPLNKKQASEYSLFIVYKNKEREEILWNLSNIKSNKITVTNQRIADFTNFQYRNYPKIQKERVEIHYYQHYKNFLEDGKYFLSIGNKKNLPPDNFSGNIAEIILYDRVLSLIERQQVASFLAIKYGVSLSQTEYENYYNSAAEKIWDYKEHKEFNQNITGLGRDTKGLIEQLTSENSNDEGVIKMTLEILEGNQIPDNYFVFWSDNGKDLEIKKQKEGQPKGISRIWLLDYKKRDKLLLHSQFDFHKFKGKKAKEDYYWLVLDTLNQGAFLPESTQYLKLGKVFLNQKYSFKNWEKLIKNQVAYSFWVAPEMFAHLEIEHPQCNNPHSGNLKFNIVGGKAPYRINIIDKEQNQLKGSWIQSNSNEKQNILIGSGIYTYQVVDAQNRSYSQDLYLSDEDMPLPKINTEYIIKEPIVINPKESLLPNLYRYEWFRNEELVSTSPQFILSEPGDYELRIKTEKGCHSAFKFKAFSADEAMNALETKVVLFPNPSKDGRFSLLASFPRKTNGNLSIFNLSGQLVKTENFYNKTQYEYNGYIIQKGIYIIVVKSGFGKKSYKLILE